MHNKPLDPKVHFIVGFLISTFSSYTLLFTKIENMAVMKLFLYIGLGFIAIAFIKLGIKYIRDGGLKKDEKTFATTLTRVPNAAKAEEYQEQIRRQNALREEKPSIIACKLCGTSNYSTSNFCHMCGYKLK